MQKNIAGIIGPIIMLLAGSSQAELIISSMGTTAGTASTIGNAVRAGKAVNFVMGAGSNYSFDLAKLSLAGATTPELNALNIGLWSNEVDVTPIAAELVPLSYTGTSSGNIHNFTPASSFTLVAGTTYWLVLERYTTSGQEVAWESFSEAATETLASNTARVFGGNSPSGQTGDPTTWQSSSGVFNAMEINGTAVPEPSTFVLLGMGAVVLLRRRRCR